MHFAENVILLTDSYKATHWRQYPPGTERVYSYLESRGGRFDEVVFFGLQYYLKRYLAGPVVTRRGIAEAESLFAAHFGNTQLFNRSGWEHVLETHGGRLPVRIRAIPEGTVVPTRNVMMTVENTDPRCYWLTNYLETLLVQVWYGSTVATLSREMRRLLSRHRAATGEPEGVGLALQDFGFRGASSVETAAVGGAAHLLSFDGTDTVAGIGLARGYYAAEMPGASIPASEHSTITAWGPEGELDAYRNMLSQFPTGTAACVSDSYDVYRACSSYWGDALRDEILARDGTLVVRPDSGEPVVVVLEVLERLGRAFGTTTNAKGYRVLPPQVRVIQGDGVDHASVDAVLTAMQREGWSADNVAFGMGGALLQKLDRDTQQFAFKCSEVTVDGRAREVFKDPVTDRGKRSQRGRLALERDRDGVLRAVAAGEARDDVLVDVFVDGALLVDQRFDEIRDRVRADVDVDVG